jgi:hypothetical protein
MINEERDRESYIEQWTLTLSTYWYNLKIYEVWNRHTVVKCLNTVCDERMLQEPSTTCSGAFESCKFSVRIRTQLEIREGQRFSNFVRDLPAYLYQKNLEKWKHHKRLKWVITTWPHNHLIQTSFMQWGYNQYRADKDNYLCDVYISI